jgi:hypothetical protein
MVHLGEKPRNQQDEVHSSLPNSMLSLDDLVGGAEWVIDVPDLNGTLV